MVLRHLCTGQQGILVTIRERALPFGRKTSVALNRYLRVRARHKVARLEALLRLRPRVRFPGAAWTAISYERRSYLRAAVSIQRRCGRRNSSRRAPIGPPSRHSVSPGEQRPASSGDNRQQQRSYRWYHSPETRVIELRIGECRNVWRTWRIRGLHGERGQAALRRCVRQPCVCGTEVRKRPERYLLRVRRWLARQRRRLRQAFILLLRWAGSPSHNSVAFRPPRNARGWPSTPMSVSVS